MLYVFGEYELDAQRFELRHAGTKVAVQPKVLDLLSYLVRARDRVVGKRELMDAVWGDATVGEASIGHAIMEARRAIGDDALAAIVTVRGRGFRFALDVAERVPGRAAEAAPVVAADDSFVGRDAPLTVASGRLDECLAGRGSLLWMTGEAGIGKTRLAEEIARRAEARGAQVLRAQAHETPGAPPLWIWSHLVRELAGPRGDAAHRGLVERLSPLPAADLRLSSAQRFALFDELSHAFVRQARARPLVLVLEDLHRADAGSLELLQFFARSVREAPVLVLCTYREGLVPNDARAGLLGGLLAESRSVSIPLRGLSVREVARLVEHTTGTPPDDALVAAMHERSGGNPLYVQELLKTSWAEQAMRTSARELRSTMDLQQGLIETIARHLDELSPGVRELLGMAAVLGREFDATRLRVVSGVAPEVLLNGIEEAQRVGLLMASGRGLHRFVHPLVRHALYKKVPAAQRAARHAIVGERLIAHYADTLEPHAAELAEHFTRALPGGDPALALRFAMLAAEQAQARGASRDAARHWRQAVDALAHAPHEGPVAVGIHLGLARAFVAMGDMTAARQSFQDAALLARTFACASALTEALAGLAETQHGPAELRVPDTVRDAR